MKDRLEAAEATIEELRVGDGIHMNDVWADIYHLERLPGWPWHYSTRSLHNFLSSLDVGILRRNHEEYLDREEGDEEEDAEEST